jgi:hypothetical protein
MNETKVPVVVTLSGKIDVAVNEGMTAEQLKAYVMHAWNIDEGQIEQPFVVVSDMFTNFGTVCEEGDAISPKLRDGSMLRVVLPLKPQE